MTSIRPSMVLIAGALPLSLGLVPSSVALDGHPGMARLGAKAFADAQQAVAARYPEDTEAMILYALVLSANFDPTDKKYTNQLRAAKILEPIFQRQPDHPGVAHYLIHSYDYPPIAAKGLDAARRYAQIAPDATHAQHMPSHIFTRVGLWKESVESNAYWAEQVDIQAEVVRGLTACADGKSDECLAILRAAADREDATEKHVVTPGPIVPARELLALVLLKAGKSSDALRNSSWCW